MKVLLAAAVVFALATSAALAGRPIGVGAVEDAAIWQNPEAQMDLAKLAGFNTIRMTAQWSNGMTILPPGQVTRLQRAAIFASMRGITPIVSIYNVNAASAPNDLSARAQFVEFAKSTVRELPWVTTFIVGNEPNSSFYWQPQFDAAGNDVAAASYEQLLAATYDGIKQTLPSATVVGGALDSHGNDDPSSHPPSHSPTAFIQDLGAAYRASGRTAPIMDVFDEHIYGDTSASPPSMQHTSSTLTEGDYPRLVALLGKAFGGTAQKGSTLPILYGEYGVESATPPSKASEYTGKETSVTVDEATQGAYYAQALRLAQCQPNVIGLVIFHVVDESALGAWQSGPFYADGAPKSSLQTIHDAAVAAESGAAATCPDRTPPSVSLSTANGKLSAVASDNIGVGKVSLFVNGVLSGVDYAAPYAFTWQPSHPGRYTLVVRAADASGNIGRTVVKIAATHARRGDAVHPSTWQFRRVR
ncbi:MAG TPA: Ig-like domain-containing protein [Gaiellaceae bacterium]